MAEREVVQAAAQVLMDAVLSLIQADPHQWSQRVCQTCRAVSAIVGQPFGCAAIAAERRAGAVERQEEK